jgi:hypothetical protein
MSSSKILRQLDDDVANGILPAELDFMFMAMNPPSTLDMSKLQYQSFYRTFEYAASQFPEGFNATEFLHPIIEASISNESPLEQMDKIHALSEAKAEQALKPQQ